MPLEPHPPAESRIAAQILRRYTAIKKLERAALLAHQQAELAAENAEVDAPPEPAHEPPAPVVEAKVRTESTAPVAPPAPFDVPVRTTTFSQAAVDAAPAPAADAAHAAHAHDLSDSELLAQLLHEDSSSNITPTAPAETTPKPAAVEPSMAMSEPAHADDFKYLDDDLDVDAFLESVNNSLNSSQAASTIDLHSHSAYLAPQQPDTDVEEEPMAPDAAPAPTTAMTPIASLASPTLEVQQSVASDLALSSSDESDGEGETLSAAPQAAPVVADTPDAAAAAPAEDIDEVLELEVDDEAETSPAAVATPPLTTTAPPAATTESESHEPAPSTLTAASDPLPAVDPSAVAEAAADDTPPASPQPQSHNEGPADTSTSSVHGPPHPPDATSHGAAGTQAASIASTMSHLAVIEAVSEAAEVLRSRDTSPIRHLEPAAQEHGEYADDFEPHVSPPRLSRVSFDAKVHERMFQRDRSSDSDDELLLVDEIVTDEEIENAALSSDEDEPVPVLAQQPSPAATAAPAALTPSPPSSDSNPQSFDLGDGDKYQKLEDAVKELQQVLQSKSVPLQPPPAKPRFDIDFSDQSDDDRPTGNSDDDDF